MFISSPNNTSTNGYEAVNVGSKLNLRNSWVRLQKLVVNFVDLKSESDGYSKDVVSD